MRSRIFIALAGLVCVALVGVLLGIWLSWHAPVDRVVEAPSPTQPLPGEAPVAAVDTQQYLPEPPQPRIDGTRGVPARRVAATQQVPMVSALDNPSPDVTVSTVAPDADALREQYGQGQDQGQPGLPSPLPAPSPRPLQSSQVTTVDVAPPGGTAPAGRGISPQLAQNGAAAAGASGDGWMGALRADLERCTAQSAGTRTACADQARWRYCGPNNGWGRTPDCPVTGNN
ncbi:hypothetical protein GCM10023144_23400 [Pigmentiphaga soli]|uniref:Uncharacterized protein n=1 Tax=Pigmentiphaga soli TaxID=1007095 RepID=A0ABP8H118_9BURK